MNYLLFANTFREFPVVSVSDIRKQFPDFDWRRLVEWQQKGYVQKVRRGFYCFHGQKKDEHFLYFSANKIYAPSYISFESALAHYQIIPEGVFITTSATTRNTAQFQTALGNYAYRNIKPSLFFGYQLISYQHTALKMASAEKAVLDYLYLSVINTTEAMEAMRFNEFQAKEAIDFGKLQKYQSAFASKALDKRVQLFKKSINA